MRPRHLLIVGAVLVSAAGAWAWSTEAPVVPWILVNGTPDAATRVRGSVVDPGGHAVADASVVVWNGLKKVETTTDAEGRFDVAVTTSSPVARCLVCAKGCAITLSPWTDVVVGAGADVGRIALAPEALIEGRAVEDGVGIPWAWVEVDGRPTYGDDWNAIANLTDAKIVDCDPADGRFVLRGLREGRYVFQGRSLGHYVGDRETTAPAYGVEVRGGGEFPDGPHLDIALRYTVGGPDVLTPKNRVVAETVRGDVEAEDAGDMIRTRFRTTPPCTLRLVGDDDVLPDFVTLDRVPHGFVDVSVVSRHSKLRGRLGVADPVKRELRVRIPESVRRAADFRLEVQAATTRWPRALPCDVNAERVLVDGLMRDDRFVAAIRVRANGAWTRRAIVRGESGGAPIDVELPTGDHIRGRVVRDGRPIAGAVVTIRNEHYEGDVAVSALDGAFDVAGFDPSAKWTVVARDTFGAAFDVELAAR